MQPVITVPLILLAIAAAIWTARKRREPGDMFVVLPAMWLIPLLGVKVVVKPVSWTLPSTHSAWVNFVASNVPADRPKPVLAVAGSVGGAGFEEKMALFVAPPSLLV